MMDVKKGGTQVLHHLFWQGCSPGATSSQGRQPTKSWDQCRFSAGTWPRNERRTGSEHAKRASEEIVAPASLDFDLTDRRRAACAIVPPPCSFLHRYGAWFGWRVP
jgi:hypothetical protein